MEEDAVTLGLDLVPDLQVNTELGLNMVVFHQSSSWDSMLRCWEAGPSGKHLGYGASILMMGLVLVLHFFIGICSRFFLVCVCLLCFSVVCRAA